MNERYKAYLEARKEYNLRVLNEVLSFRSILVPDVHPSWWSTEKTLSKWCPL